MPGLGEGAFVSKALRVGVVNQPLPKYLYSGENGYTLLFLPPFSVVVFSLRKDRAFYENRACIRINKVCKYV